MSNDLPAEAAAAQPPPCTAAELAETIESLPSPDAGYAADVQDVISNQPNVPDSPWDKG